MKKTWIKSLGLTILFIVLYLLSSAISAIFHRIYLLAGGKISLVKGLQLSLLGEIFPILMILLFSHFLLKLRTEDFWLKPPQKTLSYLKGYLVGVILFSSFIGISLLVKNLVYTGKANLPMVDILIYLPAFAIQSFQEELLTRGLLQRLIKNKWGVWPSILLPSFIFAALHLANSGMHLIAFVNIFLVGIVFALMVYATGSLWYAAAAHAAWNYVQGVIYGQHVSGIELGGSLFRFDTIGKSELLTGGQFGPEGSIIVTLILSIGLLYYYQKYRRTEEKEMSIL